MARVVANMIRAPAMFGPGKPGLFGSTSVKTSTVGFVGVGWTGQTGRGFGGVVACAGPAQTRKPRGIMKPRPITPEFQEFVGAPEISRTQALKVIWAHIKANDLQDPNNKKIIICDEKLKKIFAGKERVGFLEIAGLISPHLL